MIRAQARRAMKAIAKTATQSELGRAIAAIDVKRSHLESKGETLPPQAIIVKPVPRSYRRKKRTDREPTSRIAIGETMVEYRLLPSLPLLVG